MLKRSTGRLRLAGIAMGVLLASVSQVHARGDLAFPADLLDTNLYPGMRGILDNELQAGNLDTLYGIVAVAGLIGMFSKQALYKLSELFDVLFKTNRDQQLKGSLVQIN